MSADTLQAGGRPRSWLLALLGVAVVALLMTRVLTHWSPSPDAPPPSSRTSAQARNSQPLDPAVLDIRLEALEAPRPDQGNMERNPFRFRPRAAPAPPPDAYRPAAPANSGPPPPPGPPPAPPIPWKLMGFLELKPGVRVAALSDCRGGTWSAKEGEIVDGQYRIVRLGIESVVIEYINGKGRQTLRLEGCPPR